MGDYKAISQNLMHKDIRVTDAIYAPLLGNEIGSRIRSLSEDIVISDGTHRNLTRSLAGLSKKDRQRALVMLANSFSD